MGWLAGYLHRKAIPLTGGADGSQVDFQLKLSIAYDSDMLSDFSDLRFTDADGTTLIDAWLEDKTDGTSADVWVEFLSTPADGVTETKGYVYYGKADDVSDWDGDATFIAYHGAASAEFVDSYNVTPTNIIFEVYGKVTSSAHNIKWGLKNTAGSDVSDDVVTICSYSGDNKYYFVTYNEGTLTYTNEVPAADVDVLKKMKIIMTGGTWHAYRDDDEVGAGISTNLPDENMGLAMYFDDGTGEQEWSFARKYAANPPTYEFGSEESALTGLTILDFERAGMRGAFRGIMRGVA